MIRVTGWWRAAVQLRLRTRLTAGDMRLPGAPLRLLNSHRWITVMVCAACVLAPVGLAWLLQSTAQASSKRPVQPSLIPFADTRPAATAATDASAVRVSTHNSPWGLEPHGVKESVAKAAEAARPSIPVPGNRP